VTLVTLARLSKSGRIQLYGYHSCCPSCRCPKVNRPCTSLYPSQGKNPPRSRETRYISSDSPK